MSDDRDFAGLQHADAADDADAAPAARTVPAILFAAVAVVMLADIVLDVRAGADRVHVALETLVVILATAGAATLLTQLRRARRRATELGSRLSRASDEAARYRREAEAHLRGLSDAIDRQFEQWGLSASEREIGFLLLKGLPLKDIAAARGTSERTVRAQALALYRKASVSGRAELSAFFLEDLLAPPAPEGGLSGQRQ